MVSLDRELYFKLTDFEKTLQSVGSPSLPRYSRITRLELIHNTHLKYGISGFQADISSFIQYMPMCRFQLMWCKFPCGKCGSRLVFKPPRRRFGVCVIRRMHVAARTLHDCATRRLPRYWTARRAYLRPRISDTTTNSTCIHAERLPILLQPHLKLTATNHDTTMGIQRLSY